MTRKIVGFKIVLRPWEILRRAKKMETPLPQESEERLQAVLDKAACSLRPAVLFDTFGFSDRISSNSAGIAESLVVATLGGISPEAFGENPGILEPLIVESGLEECRKFAAGLLEDEAERDSCELGPFERLIEAEPLAAALQKMEGQKIGVSFSDGVLFPKAAAVFAVCWVSKAKRGKIEPGAVPNPVG